MSNIMVASDEVGGLEYTLRAPRRLGARSDLKDGLRLNR
ncbi:hypothetical protein PA08_2265 [Cutibacterium modestum P08]|nr:hypothetical protein PA08_2265 [Cutibacterium modestum P08]